MLHTGKSADYVNLALKDGAVSLVINLGSGAFEALVEPVNGKFNDNAWHDVKVTRNLRQVTVQRVMWKIWDQFLFCVWHKNEFYCTHLQLNYPKLNIIKFISILTSNELDMTNC